MISNNDKAWFCEAIKEKLNKEVDAIAEDEIKLAQERILERVKKAVPGICVSLFDRINIGKLGDILSIDIRCDNLEKR